MDQNPYAPPKSFGIPNSAGESDLRIRRVHRGTEEGIKVMACCYWLFAPVVAIAPYWLKTGYEIGFALLAGTIILAGIGLWRFQRWALGFAAVISGLGLLAFPIATPVNAHFLLLLFRQKGRMVFSQRYREIVRTTPRPAGGFSRWFEAIGVVLGFLFFGFILSLPLAG